MEKHTAGHFPNGAEGLLGLHFEVRSDDTVQQDNDDDNLQGKRQRSSDNTTPMNEPSLSRLMTNRSLDVLLRDQGQHQNGTQN